MEIELKFRLNAATAKRAVHALARLPSAGTPAVQKLDALYFDTRNGALRRAGLTLRVREEGGVFVQTVKRAGALARAEWSDKVSAQTPDRDAGKSGRRLARVFKDADDDTLRPRFRVKVTRTTIAILTHGAVIEAAVDIGFIHARSRRLAVHELELELKSGGTPAALHDLALDLISRLPLRLEGLSKSDRGYALAAGMFPAPVDKKPRKKPMRIRGGDTLAETLRDAGRAFLGQFAANMAAVEDGQAEGVHQMRVALRRLRGILKAAQDMLPSTEYAWVNERFKHVLQNLGPARNWDVLLETLGAAPPTLQRSAAQRRLVAAAKTRRRAARRRAVAHVMSPAATKTLLEIGRWFEGLPRMPALAVPVKTVAPELLTRAFKRMRKKGRDFARLIPEERHKLRIAGKNLRYAAELFAPLYGAGRVTTFLRRLRAAQDVLGALNDIEGAYALLGPLALPTAEFVKWLDRKAAGLAKPAARAVEKARKSRRFW